MKLIKNGKKSKYIPGGIIKGSDLGVVNGITPNEDTIALINLIKSDLILRTAEELKQSRCNAYEYLIP